MSGANPRVFQPALVPQEPPPVEEPAPEEPTSPPAEEPEGPKVFVGGRERTVEEVVKGYEASSAEAFRLKAQMDALAAERDALRREADSYRQRVVEPTAPALPELGEDPDPQQLAAWVGLVAEQRAEKIAAAKVAAVEEQFRQFMGAAQQFNAVQAQMKEMDPSFDPDKLSAYLTATPDVQQRYNAIFAGDQLAALEYGWMKAKSPGEPAQSARSVQAPPKRKAPPPSQADVTKEREKLLAEAELTGNYERYYAWRAKGTAIEQPSLKPS